MDPFTLSRLISIHINMFVNKLKEGRKQGEETRRGDFSLNAVDNRLLIIQRNLLIDHVTGPSTVLIRDLIRIQVSIRPDQDPGTRPDVYM